MKKYLIILVLLLITCTNALGGNNDTLKPFRIKGFGSGFGIGYQMVDVSRLNSLLKDNGLAKLSNHLLSVSLQFYFGDIEKGFHCSYEAKLSTMSSKKSDWRDKFTLLGFDINGNYNFYHHNNNLMHLVGGVGITNSYIRLYNKSDKPANISTTLQSNGLNKNLNSNTTVMINLGLSFTLINRQSTKESTSIKVGYKFQVIQPDWLYNESKISGVPNVNLGGFYLMFTSNINRLRK
ncbi:MAG: hypothetical protein NTU44_05285 [Bacteroidetes bacterium]|nr:hypothetical protein [Bacteroidota bacterium]